MRRDRSLFVAKQDFDAEAMEQAGINRSWFPSVRASGTMAGSTSGGIPVFVSLGDNQASFLARKDIHRTVLLNIGTGALSIHEPTNGPDVPEGLEARPFPGAAGRLSALPFAAEKLMQSWSSFSESYRLLYR